MLDFFFRKDKKMENVVVVLPEKISIEKLITEEEIRLHAYFLWENSGCEGNSEDFWYRAEEDLRLQNQA